MEGDTSQAVEVVKSPAGQASRKAGAFRFDANCLFRPCV